MKLNEGIQTGSVGVPDYNRQPGVAESAQHLAETGAEQAGVVKDTVLADAAEVAGVAKDELAKLASDARTQVQGLWSQASGQLREQAGNGKQQLGDLLHSLAAELGQMASKSDDGGRATSTASTAARTPRSPSERRIQPNSRAEAVESNSRPRLVGDVR